MPAITRKLPPLDVSLACWNQVKAYNILYIIVIYMQCAWREAVPIKYIWYGTVIKSRNKIAAVRHNSL